jgi:hypothetical protein
VDAADYTNSVTGKTDVTFDNYYASTNGPILVDFQRTPHPVPNMPQVANRTPATRANFYAYTNGLSFTATTLTTNAINSSAIRLFLNGANVSSTLAMSGPSNNVDVAFNGLMPNTVYDARIELSDFSGRATTNEFSFDTFDESYLDSPGVKVIEAEDYNYGGGQFQDDPPVSGLDSVGAPVNGSGVGYYDLIGTGGVDFFDFSTAPGSGAAADYRTQDPVGTQAGSATEIDNAGVINDTIRAKYASQDLSEYEVRGTEGGEWLNFTRVFTNATYNVYLREACRAPQTVYLDKVTGDATQTNQTTVRIGAFNVPSTAMLINYSYTPLVDTNGNLAAINLSGTNTLRLTFGGPQTDATKYTMVLNYLVFAPVVTAQIIVESSADVGGTFTTDNTAGVDTATRTITAPLNGSIRFYRIRSGAPPALTITNVRIAGANVVMNYQ